ncbi:MAG: hypothetical protein FWG09_00790, partial [Synergistaceae bacterium]|nr:hypothetical protein [Synergistaceae bacterium]
TRRYAKKISAFALFTFILLSCGGEALAAVVDAKSCAVYDGLLYRVDQNGQKKQVEAAEVVEAAVKGGKIYWLAVDPEFDGEDEEMFRSWRSGIYFFGGDGKFISCLEKEDPQMSYIIFSPDGKQFVLDSGTYVDRDYKLYAFDGLKLKKEFYGLSELEWLDPARFVFTLIDGKHGARSSNADIPGWTSVVVYDSASGSIKTLAAATKTEDYMLDAVNISAKELSITKYSVKNEKDWSNEDKIEEQEISLPIPPN